MAARTLRIFVSSPGDVGQERVIASRVLERLQGEFAGFVVLEPILWEHEPLRATSHFQKQITTPSDTDIVICILWSRLGTRLPAEQFRKVDGTPYASGTEWEFEDAAAAYLSKGTPDLVVYRKLAEPLLDYNDERATLERLGQKKALDVFMDRWFGNPEQGFKAAFHGFRTADEFEELLDVHLRKLIRERLPEHLANEGEGAIPIRWFKGTPYRGLEAFDFEHAPVFYGRTRAIGAVKEALIRRAAGGCAFVLVFGMSGGGKSSLVRAGVLPTITHPGVVDGVGLWRWCAFRPSDARLGDLFDGLAGAMLGPAALPEMAQTGVAGADLAAGLRDDPARAAEAVRAALAHAARAVAEQEALSAPPTARLAVMIDQMEELWTREGVGAAERERFVAALDALARSGAVWVIGTMRSDFYPRCAEIPALVAMKEGAGQYDLLPPTFAEIGQMIRFPTRAAGLRFEVNPRTGEGLDDVLHEAAAKDPAALPLLEFTLDELFRQRTAEHILSFAAYESLGGMEGALARRAEEVFQALPPPVQSELPSLLRALVTVDEGEDGPVVSRRVPLAGVAATPVRRALADAFVAARLLVTDRADNGEAVVRVAHEALLRQWPRVQQWLAENRDFLRIRSRLADSEALWRREERRPDLLLPSGKPLAEAEDVLRRRRDDLDPAVVGFIEASEQRARGLHRIRTRSIAAVTAAFCAVVLGFGAFSLGEARKARSEAQSANRQKRAADVQRSVAEQARLSADAQRRAAVLARRESEQARRESEQARQQSEQARRAAETQQAIAQQRTAEARRQKQLADEQRQIAEVQKAVAERNFGHALGAADTMVTDVADGVAPIAGTQSVTVRNILASASQVYDALARENPTPAVLEGKARMLNSFVDIYLKLNDSGRADANARQALALYQRLLQRAPGNAAYEAGVARSQEMLSKVRARQGRLPDEVSALRAALALRTRMLGRDPGSLTLQADVSRTLGSLGGALHDQGDKTESGADYEAALQGWQRLVQRDPRNPRWRQELASSRNNRGDVAWYADDYAQAETLYQEALDADESLVRGDPSNTDLQRNLARATENMAFIFKEKGDSARAVAAFDRAIALARRFSALDPTNVNWLNLLLDCRLQRTDVVKTGGDARNLHERLAAAQEVYPTAARLARQDPGNALIRDSLCLMLEASGLARARLAQLGEDPRENWPQSLRDFQAVSRLGLGLHRLDPTNIRWESRLMVSDFDLSNWYGGQGKDGIARDYMLKGMRIRTVQDARLAARFPDDAKARHRLAEDYFYAAVAEQMVAAKQASPQGRLVSALRSLGAGEGAYRQALAMPGADAAWRNDLANCLYSEGTCRQGLAEQKVSPQENRRKALQAVRAADAEYRRSLARKPDDVEALKGLLSACALESQVLYAQGRADEAKAASAVYRQLDERLSGRLASSQATGRAAAEGVSVSTGAESALNAGPMMEGLRRELALMLPLYLAQPTTAHYRDFVNASLDLSRLLRQTPSPENLAEARKALATGYAAFERIKAGGKLTPAEAGEQGALQKTLVEAFGQIPKGAP